MKLSWPLLCVANTVSALTIAEINGSKFISPYKDQNVTGVVGLVVAQGPSGIWIRSTTPDDDVATSEAIYVFGSSVGNATAVGDVIKLDGRVQEYRSADAYLYLTEISSPKNIVMQSSGNDVVPLVIGQDTLSPPTEQYSSLDAGDVYGVPNGVANISVVNPVLQPSKYGLDFWESINGELVTVKKPVVIGRPNQYGDTWVVGDWKVSGRNGHGGLTTTDGDGNPEGIIIGSPLDRSKNPDDSKMGDELEEFTGVVTYAFGFYRILPQTALKVTKSASTTISPVSFTSNGTCKGISVGDYNAENLMPNSTHLPKVASQIIEYLRTPDLVFLQEIQDNSGATDDGIVDANATLTTLVAKIEELSGIAYDFADIDPVNNKDGGQPGGNIRVAYLYRPDVLELYKPNAGGSMDANEVVAGPELKYNPGRIDPANDAWEDSRKPVAAMWRTVQGKTQVFFTVNVHFSSKGGSTSLHGDVRPPLNGAIQQRQKQAEVAGTFIHQILAKDPNARIIAAGDFNEFAFVKPMDTFAAKSGLLDLDAVAAIPRLERYTYLFDMNTQELDHMYISPALGAKARYEHLHLNSWQAYDEQVSDHDPSVGMFDVCGC